MNRARNSIVASPAQPFSGTAPRSHRASHRSETRSALRECLDRDRLIPASGRRSGRAALAGDAGLPQSSGCFMALNALDQPIGPALPGWEAPEIPPREIRLGRFCALEPLDSERHARDLFAANELDLEGRNWTYLPYGPFADFGAYENWLRDMSREADPQFYAILDRTSGRATGVCAYLRLAPDSGCIEVGHLNYSPVLQKQPAATEAMYLMMQRVFELGYRRYEWKCDALNAPSRAAALRLGFSFEGIFRQAMVYKGRSRDTAWYSVIDSEWPTLHRAYQDWLDSANFDGTRQRARLAECIASSRRRAG